MHCFIFRTAELLETESFDDFARIVAFESNGNAAFAVILSVGKIDVVGIFKGVVGGRIKRFIAVFYSNVGGKRFARLDKAAGLNCHICGFTVKSLGVNGKFTGSGARIFSLERNKHGCSTDIYVIAVLYRIKILRNGLSVYRNGNRGSNFGTAVSEDVFFGINNRVAVFDHDQGVYDKGFCHGTRISAALNSGNHYGAVTSFNHKLEAVIHSFNKNLAVVLYNDFGTNILRSFNDVNGRSNGDIEIFNRFCSIGYGKGSFRRACEIAAGNRRYDNFTRTYCPRYFHKIRCNPRLFREFFRYILP